MGASGDGFWVAFADPEAANPDPACPFCKALPFVRESCDQGSDGSMDVVLVELDVDGLERTRYHAIRELGGDPVPVWDDLDLAVDEASVVVSGVVGWGAQSEGLVDPSDMGLWNPGLTMVRVHTVVGRLWGRVDPIVEISRVAFGTSLDPRAPGERWVLHDSIVAPGGLDEGVISYGGGDE